MRELISCFKCKNEGYFLRLLTLLVYALVGFSESSNHSEDRKKVEFFEKLYGIKIVRIKPFGQFDDSDTFYSEIAKQVGIPEMIDRKIEFPKAKYLECTVGLKDGKTHVYVTWF